MREVFDLLLRIQKRCNIDLLVIGGWALQAHGYSRNTVDVDCMTAIENDSLLGEELIEAGFECFDEMASFRRFRHRLAPVMVIDVMRVDQSTFAKMWLVAQTHDLNGYVLHVPTLTHMIALKLHAARNPHRAAKDTEDLRQLLIANSGKISAAELQQLCDKFGTPALHQCLQPLL